MPDDDQYAALAPAYALGALDPQEAAAFEAHLAAGCAVCEPELDGQMALLGTLPLGEPVVAPDPLVKQQLLDLTAAPRGPIDVSRYAWEELVPGVRCHIVSEDPLQGRRSCLIWADEGAKHPEHRHLGDEVILVLEGAIRDHTGEYGPGQICRSRSGSVHTEEVANQGRCICFVVYYGELEMLA